MDRGEQLKVSLTALLNGSAPTTFEATPWTHARGPRLDDRQPLLIVFLQPTGLIWRNWRLHYPRVLDVAHPDVLLVGAGNAHSTMECLCRIEHISAGKNLDDRCVREPVVDRREEADEIYLDVAHQPFQLLVVVFTWILTPESNRTSSDFQFLGAR